jgi:hypothetical protein
MILIMICLIEYNNQKPFGVFNWLNEHLEASAIREVRIEEAGGYDPRKEYDPETQTYNLRNVDKKQNTTKENNDENN